LVEGLFPDGAVLVVGGSGGIGRFVCREFANAGTSVALTYKSKKEVADEVVDDIKSVGQNSNAYALNVGDTDQVNSVIESVEKDFGRIHTVVYGAAPLAEQVHIAETSSEQWTRAMDLETNGFFRVVQATVPRLRAKGGGSYVHLGSAGHLRWPDKDGLSVIPKAANEAVIQGIAREEGKHGIRANTVLIGVIEAGMFLELTKQGAFPQAWVDETQKLLALKRWGKPEEVGHAAVFLASDKAAYVTGQRIAVAGGFGV
jgi:3-oxoacyl-[acyl-carrier protein] reductase